MSYKKGQVWNKPKNKLMLKFESETSKNAIYNGKITGQFEYWLWQQQKVLQKQLEAHWEATEKERKITHTGKLYEKQIETYKTNYINKLKIKEEREKQQETLTFLRKSQVKIQQYLKEPDYPAAKTRLALAKRRLHYLIDKDNIQKWTNNIKKLEKEIDKQLEKEKTTQKRRTKEETYQIRLKILKILYWDIFLGTADLASYAKITIKEAYRHATWLENHNLIYGEASSGTGTSTPRGTYRIKSILWEPVYAEERGHKWEDIVKKLKNEMRYKL